MGTLPPGSGLRLRRQAVDPSDHLLQQPDDLPLLASRVLCGRTWIRIEWGRLRRAKSAESNARQSLLALEADTKGVVGRAATKFLPSTANSLHCRQIGAVHQVKTIPEAERHIRGWLHTDSLEPGQR